MTESSRRQFWKHVKCHNSQPSPWPAPDDAARKGNIGRLAGSAGQVQRFPCVHGPVHNLFRVGRHHPKRGPFRSSISGIDIADEMRARQSAEMS